MSFEKLISFRRFMVLSENKELQKIGDDVVAKITAANKIAAAGITDVETQLKVITNYIRQVIQGSWVGQEKELAALQKVAFNIEDMLSGNTKASDSTDITAMLNACTDHIQSVLTSKTKSPLNTLGVDQKDIPAAPKGDTMVEEPQAGVQPSQEPVQSSPQQPQGMQMDQGSLPPLGAPTDDARPNA